MLVCDYMTSPPITIHADMPFQDALKRMREQEIRRLPVVDQRGWLVGIVSERDLLYASPSPATSLDVWEMTYLLSKVSVAEVMTKELSVVHPNAPLSRAARLLLENKIGGLPVVDDQNQIVGVLTETDIFKAFVDAFVE